MLFQATPIMRITQHSFSPSTSLCKAYFFLCLHLVFTSAAYSQNNKVRGIVKLQSSGSQTLEGVKISSFGATTVYSNSDGQFELLFQRKVEGDEFSLEIKKEGYELINDKDLETEVIRKDPDDLVVVVMAKAGDRNKQALLYYDIIVEKADQKYDRDIAEIKEELGKLGEGDEERRILLQQIATLQEEKEAAIQRAEDLAKQLASIDLDIASDLAKEAYEKFDEGDIEGAIAVLDDDKLEQSAKAALEERAKAQQLLVKADSALQYTLST